MHQLFLGRLDWKYCLTGEAKRNKQRGVVIEIEVEHLRFNNAVILNQVRINNGVCLVELRRLTGVENLFSIGSPQREQVDHLTVRTIAQLVTAHLDGLSGEKP